MQREFDGFGARDRADGRAVLEERRERREILSLDRVGVEGVCRHRAIGRLHRFFGALASEKNSSRPDDKARAFIHSHS